MECAVCEVRSSVGYCCDCSKLLCEECATKCAVCQKLICPDHVHVTSHGRELCSDCKRDRDAKRARRKASVHSDDEMAMEEVAAAGAAEEHDTGDEAEDEVYVLSGWQPTPPWKLSLYASAVAFLLGFLLLLVPGFQGMMQPWMSIIAGVVAMLGIVWSVIGLVSERYVADRSKCFIGIGMAALAIIVSGLAAALYPSVNTDEDVLGIGTVRGNMTEQQLKEFRRGTLDKYKAPPKPTERSGQ